MAECVNWLLIQIFNLWASTWRVHYIDIGPFLESTDKGIPVGLWHEYLLVVAFVMRFHAQSFIPFVSQSKDGARAAGWLRHLGYECIRGSSSRGGQEAYEQGLEKLKSGHSIAITMDGPRGPRRSAKTGVLRLGQAVSRPYWYVGVRASGIRLKSWDKMLIPWPFSRVEVYFSTPNEMGNNQSIKDYQAWLKQNSDSF